MKKLLFVLWSAVLATTTQAQEKPKRDIRYYLSIGADYQLNKADIINQSVGNNKTTAPNMLGGAFGIGQYRKTKWGITASFGLNFKYTPQKLVAEYHPSDVGYTNNNTYLHEEKYFNFFVAPSVKLGYSLNLGSNKRSIDLALGIMHLIPINGKNQHTTVTENITDDQYSNVVMYINSKQGNSTQTFALMNLALLQCAYHTNIANKQMQIGISYSAMITHEGASVSINRAAINYIGVNSSDAGYSSFADKFESIIFFIGIEL